MNKDNILITNIEKKQVDLINISISNQRLFVCFKDNTRDTYVISSSSNGIGCEGDSYKTPIGWHAVYKKFGGDEPLGMIFKARKPTGEIAKIITEPVTGKGDCITSRILWLEGLEQGVNKGGNCDSKERYIYIHGTNEEGLLGREASIGCIRMSNADVIKIYDMVDVGTRVLIS